MKILWFFWVVGSVFFITLGFAHLEGSAEVHYFFEFMVCAFVWHYFGWCIQVYETDRGY